MAVGGSNRYPSLQMIAQLFRAMVNDSFSGATGTPGGAGTTWSNVTCPDGTNSNNNSNTCVGHFLPVVP